jgi:hypothetical protein
VRHVAALHNWFIIVQRDKPVLYQHLLKSYTGDARVHVIVDRRAPSTALPPEADARRGERRKRDRRTMVTADRRQAQRRQRLAALQRDFWITKGFFMVRRVIDTSA